MGMHWEDDTEDRTGHYSSRGAVVLVLGAVAIIVAALLISPPGWAAFAVLMVWAALAAVLIRAAHAHAGPPPKDDTREEDNP